MMAAELQNLNTIPEEKIAQYTHEMIKKNRLLKKTNQVLERKIMEQRKIEQALCNAERTRVLTEIAGAASHEISQPLQIIIGSCHLLLKRIPPHAPHRDLIQTIFDGAKRISDIIYSMQNIKQYSTKHYLDDIHIVDFDASTQEQDKSNAG